MKVEILKLMKCPCCGFNFNLEGLYGERNGAIINGSVKCECSEYPIIEGILKLSHSPFDNHLVQMIKKGRTKQATEICLEAYTNRRINSKSIIHKAIGLLVSKGLSSLPEKFYKKYSEKNLFHFTIQGSDPNALYRKYRLLDPSFWAIYSFLPILKKKKAMILDLCCGIGHTSFLISNYVKPEQLVCADKNFANVYFAKKYFVKDASFICLDADYKLPFRDKLFSSILMMDSLHFVKPRAQLSEELRRLLDPNGLLLLLHVFNSLKYISNCCYSLTPSSWIKMFHPLTMKAYPEGEIVKDYSIKNKLSLERNYSQDELDSSDALCFVGTRDKSIFQTYHEVRNHLFSVKKFLIVNPVYTICQKRNKIILDRKNTEKGKEVLNIVTDKKIKKQIAGWTEELFSHDFLPEKYIIEDEYKGIFKGFVIDSSELQSSKKKRLYIEDLMRRFIVINVATNYFRTHGAPQSEPQTFEN